MIAGQAGTIKFVLSLPNKVRLALGVVQTRHVDTTREFYGAVFAPILGVTVAVVIGPFVDAPAVYARFVDLTFVDVLFAQFSLETFVALALEPSDFIDALPLTAGGTLALIDVGLAVLSHHSGDAVTNITGKFSILMCLLMY